jgi:hypothetical protein
MFKISNFNVKKTFRMDLLSLLTKYKRIKKQTGTMEYFRNFEISGYLLGAISTGYISDRKTGEISEVPLYYCKWKCVCHVAADIKK